MACRFSRYLAANTAQHPSQHVVMNSTIQNAKDPQIIPRGLSNAAPPLNTLNAITPRNMVNIYVILFWGRGSASSSIKDDFTDSASSLRRTINWPNEFEYAEEERAELESFDVLSASFLSLSKSGSVLVGDATLLEGWTLGMKGGSASANLPSKLLTDGIVARIGFWFLLFCLAQSILLMYNSSAWCIFLAFFSVLCAMRLSNKTSNTIRTF
mmetsp:Transcript_13440/g.16981  ORF Transcript_13440/g.16981 Transcript_13440/m.16981 type:complete len:212 (-) Transcript_13440:845-1480(-)